MCYDCNDEHWKEFNTGWMDSNVAIARKLKGHDVRRIEVIPDEEVITLLRTIGLKESSSPKKLGSGGMRK